MKMEIKRAPFYEPREIFQEVQAKIERTGKTGVPIDYLTFVPDGEPSLDINLGREIELLRPLGIQIAVITNGSLTPLEDVRAELAGADWVSLKVDSTRERVWRKVDRPHRALHLAPILDGMLEFAGNFRGKLVTETMLVAGVNDEEGHLREVAQFLERLQPAKAYVSIPTRPPAEKWAKPSDENGVNQAYQIFSEHLGNVEYLIGYEGTGFTPTGNPAEDILAITSVHPMRQDAVEEFLLQASTDWSVIERLIEQGQLIEMQYRGKRFFMRRLPSRVGAN
jgi:wyosine [tRNA(Phe)-imidazoG37] synthetase (radical SAM superfamily)